MIKKIFLWVAWTFIGISSLLLIAGILFFDDPDADAEEQSEMEVLAEKIEAASPEQIRQINALMEESVVIDPRAYALKSEHHENAWWVGGKISGRGIEGEAGVWLVSGDKDAPGAALPATSWAETASVAMPVQDTRYWNMSMLPQTNALRLYVANH